MKAPAFVPWRFGVARAVLGACVASYVASGSSESQPPPQPTFRTEANYVRVDVYPTKDGAPVTDLRQDDFEVLEDRAPQKIEQFEHVVIRAAGPQETRIEPNTVAESRAMAESSRARLFVVFLDIGHVEVADSHRIRRPLIEALNQMIGQDDLVAVMTPEMSPRDLTFARKTSTIEGLLTRHWYWGERDRLNPVDPVEQLYEYCYGLPRDNPLTAEMIARRREKHSIDALIDLARTLRGIREERKAVVAITQGWRLYGPNPGLMRMVNRQVPSGPTVGIDPRTGKLTTRDEQNPAGATYSDCERDRMQLAQIDNRYEFMHVLLDEANRANASFYPLDPRGLPVFDSPIYAALPLDVDAAILREKVSSLRTLAEATDGLAMVNSNDLTGSFRRIVADLTSYYLLGYYSTGKLDGKFHSITVRVKRPGVQVRARRGYLAATTAAVAAAAAASAAAPSAEAAAEAVAIESALAPLPGFARETPLRVDVVAGWRRAGVAGFWVVGEYSAGTPPGRTIDATVVGSSGATVARGSSESGARNVLLALTPADSPEPGEYVVRVRGDGFGTATVRVKLPPAPDAGGALVMRRGQTTGNREVPTADRRFRRGEQVRIEIPAPESAAATGRLLDRTGKPLAVPVTVTTRDDSDGVHWQSAQLTLAPLAPADYIVELTNGSSRILVGFRVVP